MLKISAITGAMAARSFGLARLFLTFKNTEHQRPVCREADESGGHEPMGTPNDFEDHRSHAVGADVDPTRRCDAMPERRPARGFGFVMAALPLLLSALVSCSGNSSHLLPALASADSILQAAVEEEHIPGAVVLIAQHGKTIYQRAYGSAQLYDYGLQRMDAPLPMTAEHRFDLASLTKVFATTFGIMFLVDQQKVDLDAPVFTYLPAFRDPGKDSVTVRHLLTHSAGLYPWKPL